VHVVLIVVFSLFLTRISQIEPQRCRFFLFRFQRGYWYDMRKSYKQKLHIGTVMETKKHSLPNPRMFLWVLLTLLIARPAFGAFFWKGKLKVVSVKPWKIEIIESNARSAEMLRAEKTGLPDVTEKHWICTGRLPAKTDIGWVYEFTGTIPDIGGCYSFEVGEQSLSFRSRWSQLPAFIVPLIIIVVVLVTVVVVGAYVYTKIAKK